MTTSNKLQIVGISGTNGSGKDTVAAMLAERFNFTNASATQMLADELIKRGLPTSREQKRTLSAEWRRESGTGVIVDKAVELAQKANASGLAVGSLRNPGEADRVHELGGVVVWVDAEPEVRYKRVQKNAREGREAEDNKTFEEFLAEEKAEMSHSGDEATLNMAGVRDKADLTLLNNGNDIGAFKQEAEATLKKYLRND